MYLINHSEAFYCLYLLDTDGYDPLYQDTSLSSWTPASRYYLKNSEEAYIPSMQGLVDPKLSNTLIKYEGAPVKTPFIFTDILAIARFVRLYIERYSDSILKCRLYLLDPRYSDGGHLVLLKDIEGVLQFRQYLEENHESLLCNPK